MATKEPIRGSAAIQGELWGARARDWAEVQEDQHTPLYEAVLHKAGVGSGTALLDIGCGGGLLCAMAAQRGARVAGIDAAAALITIAQERVPGGDFRAGEMEALPYADNTFDVITGFNSFQYAANPMNALHEARRVGRPGAQVVMTTWGRPEDCETAAYLAALRPLASPAPPGAPGPFSLSAAGALEALVARAGLTPTDAADVDCPFVYPDLETALRGLLSAGPAVKAIQTSGEERVREAIGNVLEAFKNTAGHYRIANTFRYLIARIE